MWIPLHNAYTTGWINSPSFLLSWWERKNKSLIIIYIVPHVLIFMLHVISICNSTSSMRTRWPCIKLPNSTRPFFFVFSYAASVAYPLKIQLLLSCTKQQNSILAVKSRWAPSICSTTQHDPPSQINTRGHPHPFSLRRRQPPEIKIFFT